MAKGNPHKTQAETNLLLLKLTDTEHAAEILATTLYDILNFYANQGVDLISIEEVHEIIELNKTRILK